MSVGDKPETARGAGWYALTETSLARLTRENWGYRIKDGDGRKKDTGVQDAMDELVAFLANTAPIDQRTPLAINNNTGGNAAINIYNSPQNVDQGITVNNSNTGDYINIAPTGVTFGNTINGDSLTMNNLFQTVRNEGDTSYPVNITAVTDVFNITTIIGGPGGGNDGPGGCVNVIRLFTLQSAIEKHGVDPTVNGMLRTWNVKLGVYEESGPHTLKTDLVRGPAAAGDVVAAVYMCGEKQWYVLTTNKGWSGTFPTIYANSDPVLVIDPGCTITLTYTKYTQVFKDGVLKMVTDEAGVEVASNG